MPIAARAKMTRASSAVISLVRRDVRLDSLRRARQGRHARLLVRFAVMAETRAYEDGSRSTYPTPRRVWISLGSLVSTLRRSTDTYDSTMPVSPRKS